MLQSSSNKTIPASSAPQPTSALNDLLDDLTPRQLTELIQHLWGTGSVSRAQLKRFRQSQGLPSRELQIDFVL
jgi:hypothetical protein